MAYIRKYSFSVIFSLIMCFHSGGLLAMFSKESIFRNRKNSAARGQCNKRIMRREWNSQNTVIDIGAHSRSLTKISVSIGYKSATMTTDLFGVSIGWYNINIWTSFSLLMNFIWTAYGATVTSIETKTHYARSWKLKWYTQLICSVVSTQSL